MDMSSIDVNMHMEFLVAKQLYKSSMSVRMSPKSDLSDIFFFNQVNVPANT
jgi:hypothetical protein